MATFRNLPWHLVAEVPEQPIRQESCEESLRSSQIWQLPFGQVYPPAASMFRFWRITPERFDRKWRTCRDSGNI